MTLLRKTPLRAKKPMKRGKKPLVSRSILKASKPMERKPFKAKKRKATGELALFIILYHERGRVSELSGLPLFPPGHPKFHHQGSHLLPKGTYPELRLRKENLSMVTPEEHATWETVKDKERLVALDQRWIPIVTRYYKLRREANTR